MQPQTTRAIIAATKIPVVVAASWCSSSHDTTASTLYMTLGALSLSQKIGQLGDIGRNPSRAWPDVRRARPQLNLHHGERFCRLVESVD
jgi:hypothetical protein